MQPDAHPDDAKCLSMAVRAILRVREYVGDNEEDWRHPDFVRTVITAAGHPEERMALDTFTWCAPPRLEPSRAPRALRLPVALHTPRSPCMRSMLIFYSTRMFDDDHWSTTTNHHTFDADSGYYLEALRAVHFIGGARLMQVLRGYGFSGMVLNGTVKRGAYRWKALTHEDQRNRFLVNGMPCDRLLRPRTVRRRRL